MVTQGWFDAATVIASPHKDPRPDIDDISLLVIHNISLPPGQFGTSGIKQLFTGTLKANEHPFYGEIAHLRVSAHCVIQRTGAVEQYVNFNERAWHAGVSSFQGRRQCNDYAIGIELEGTDDIPYTQAQYDALIVLTRAIMETYGKISLGRIVGHNDIAPGRKTDPGVAFNWAYFRSQLVTTHEVN
jgi:AmpD protein